MNKRILGFDVSSSCIGYCVLEIDKDDNINYVSMNYLQPKKKGTIIERIVDTRDKVKKIIEEIKPDYIGVEDLIKFMPASTATTVVVLTTFNRMICLLAYDHLQQSPELCNVMSIRHGLKLNKDLPKKEDMPELVANRLNIKFPYKYDKKGKISAISMDMADGVAVALYCAFKLTNKLKTKKAKKSKS